MEVAVVNYFVGGLGFESYKGIAIEVEYNFVHMLAVDCVVYYIHVPFPYFDFLLSHIESFDLRIVHYYLDCWSKGLNPYLLFYLTLENYPENYFHGNIHCFPDLVLVLPYFLYNLPGFGYVVGLVYGLR